MSGWIGVDLDGTLALYDGWKGAADVGEPIPAMAFRVRKWLADGRDVRVFTARATVPEQAEIVAAWTEKHFGVRLPVVCCKDFAMIELWDDRAIQIEANTGRRMDGKP